MTFPLDYEYDYEDGEEYDYGSDNDGDAPDDLIEIENAFYEGDGEETSAVEPRNSPLLL